MWLFGQLDTVGASKAQQQTNENAKAVAGLLQQLGGLQVPPPPSEQGIALSE